MNAQYGTHNQILGSSKLSNCDILGTLFSRPICSGVFFNISIKANTGCQSNAGLELHFKTSTWCSVTRKLQMKLTSFSLGKTRMSFHSVFLILVLIYFLLKFSNFRECQHTSAEFKFQGCAHKQSLIDTVNVVYMKFNGYKIILTARLNCSQLTSNFG